MLQRMRSAWRGGAVALVPEWRWQLYLEELPTRAPEVTSAHASLVRRLWEVASAKLGFVLPAPVTQLTNEGSIQLVWDRGHHYVEVDVYPNATVAWFYKNSVTGMLAGSEGEDREPIDALPLILVNRLRLLRG